MVDVAFTGARAQELKALQVKSKTAEAMAVVHSSWFLSLERLADDIAIEKGRRTVSFYIVCFTMSIVYWKQRMYDLAKPV